MTIEFKALSSVLGVEVLGLDPAAAYDAETTRRLRVAFSTHHLLLLRGQAVSAEDQVRFAERFGPVSRLGANMKHGGKTMRISNVHADGAFPTGELLFHSDHVYFERPLKAIALYGEAVPGCGGDTLFANAARAWDNLPRRLKERIAALKARNVYDYSLKRGDQRLSKEALSAGAAHHVHPIAWPHPETGRTILLVNRMMTDEVIGLDQAESEALLAELLPYIEDPGNVYRHRWRLHDLVVWDNRILQHARTDFDPSEARVLRRVPVAEESATA
ncbi:MAG: TauD/TfdA dioxygenase family protein [Alphaproteobacteria bacterium]